nr:MAG: putative coat protein [XiangYun toti-like virus 11]
MGIRRSSRVNTPLSSTVLGGSPKMYNDDDSGNNKVNSNVRSLSREHPTYSQVSFTIPAGVDRKYKDISLNKHSSGGTNATRSNYNFINDGVRHADNHVAKTHKRWYDEGHTISHNGGTPELDMSKVNRLLANNKDLKTYKTKKDESVKYKKEKKEEKKRNVVSHPYGTETGPRSEEDPNNWLILSQIKSGDDVNIVNKKKKLSELHKLSVSGSLTALDKIRIVNEASGIYNDLAAHEEAVTDLGKGNDDGLTADVDDYEEMAVDDDNGANDPLEDGLHYLYREKDSYRLYKSGIDFRTTPNGKVVNDHVDITYRIGIRSAFVNCMRSMTLVPSVRTMHQNFVCSTVVTDGFTKYAQRYNPAIQISQKMDLSALIEQLAAGLAAFTHTGLLHPTDLSLGQVPDVMTLNTNRLLSSPGDGCVYVARGIDSQMTLGTLCAIVHATAGCGGKIVTDYLAVDVNTNSPILHNFCNAVLAEGCILALRYIAALYEVNGVSDMFSLALARGINRVTTISGHSDEGSFMRKVLRVGAFSRPYGFVSPLNGEASSLPMPRTCSVASYRIVFDSMALGVAALVAESDPGMMVAGKPIPFMSVCPADSNIHYGSQHISNISRVAIPFSRNYLRNLNRYFGLTSYGGSAEYALGAMLTNSWLCDDRHLNYSSVAPFYWIEPTTIISDMWVDSSDAWSPSGAILRNTQFVRYDAFTNFFKLADRYRNSYMVDMCYHSLRTDPIFMWLASRLDDGLVNIGIMGCDVGCIVQPGPAFIYSTDIDSNDMLGMQSLRWRWSDNPLPKPTEAIYLGEGMRLNFEWLKDSTIRSPTRGSRNAYTVGVIPDSDSISDFSIEMRVNRPEYVSNGRIGLAINGSQRAYNRGMKAINAALYIREIGGSLYQRPCFTYGDIHVDYGRTGDSNVMRKIDRATEAFTDGVDSGAKAPPTESVPHFTRAELPRVTPTMVDEPSRVQVQKQSAYRVKVVDPDANNPEDRNSDGTGGLAANPRDGGSHNPGDTSRE